MPSACHRPIVAAIFFASGAVLAADPAGSPSAHVAAVAWDPAGIAHTIDAARQAREHGDVMGAERLCHDAFQSIDTSALAAYDAYADRLRAEQRPEEATVRAQAARLHEVKAQQGQSTQPTSTYLGFSTSGGLNAYADLLQGLHEPDEAARMRSLALAYQQVQQAHFQRTQMFQQGKDPRGAC
jgi:hypothetical protein